MASRSKLVAKFRDRFTHRLQNQKESVEGHTSHAEPEHQAQKQVHSLSEKRNGKKT